MPSEIDIYRSANVLIRQYGNRADLVAIDHSRRLAAIGDTIGSAVWVRFMKAAKEILWMEPGAGGKRY